MVIIEALQKDPPSLRFIANPLVITGSIETIAGHVASENLATLQCVRQTGGWDAINRIAQMEIGRHLDFAGTDGAVRLQRQAMKFCSLWFKVRSLSNFYQFYIIKQFCKNLNRSKFKSACIICRNHKNVHITHPIAF